MIAFLIGFALGIVGVLIGVRLERWRHVCPVVKPTVVPSDPIEIDHRTCAVITRYYRDGQRVSWHSVCPGYADAPVPRQDALQRAWLVAMTETTHWVH